MGSSGYVCRLLRFPPLRNLGKYSYGMYILHYPIVLLLSSAETRVRDSYGHSSALVSLSVVVLGFFASYLAALLSWNLLEKHFLRLKDRFEYGRSSSTISVAHNETVNP
jgi:peptidoglycan/LPS O-acetylase OafA/YrhL